jgi:tripartite ATP-independent transporter DctM subunit
MLFAACSGSSLASAATIGSVGYPQLSKRGYDAKLALGSIAAGGTLGILIPPSIIFIIYGTLAEVSIGKLFLAGVFPGLLMGVVFSVYIAMRALFDPNLAPRESAPSWREVGHAILSLWQVVVLMIVVFGGIYGGIASPTEIAGVAAALTLIFAAVEGKLTLKILMTASLNTVRQTSMLMLVIIMAKVLSLTLIYGHLPSLVMEWVQTIGANKLHLVLFVIGLYLIMGMFFDGLSMMVITLPLIVPIMIAANVDLVWLGVIACIAIEIGLLTPPVGLNLFVMQAATGEALNKVIYGSLPFVGLQIVVITIIILYPPIATFLPARLF